MAEGRDPFVRVQYNYSREIEQLDITVILENGITYKVLVKQLPYTREELDICSKFTYSNRSIKKTVTVKCNRPLQGKYIEIVASSPAETTLKVFEIERFECANGTYGGNCSKICSDGCNKQCDKNTGDCICKGSRWGNLCNQTCPSSCDKNTCNSNTGACIRDTGYCEKCKIGYMGDVCNQSCPDHCVHCDQNGYKCLTCVNKRNQTCAYGCEDGWFGELCDDKCSAAVLNCVQCFLTDNAPVCTHCADRWYLMDTNCIKCPENCSLCVSSEECLECKNTFYYGKTCNLTCNTACINKTCDITGICEHGCDNSKYGKECDKECMKHCKTCLNSTMCLECEDGYFGKSCTMCPKCCDGCIRDHGCPIGSRSCTSLVVYLGTQFSVSSLSSTECPYLNSYLCQKPNPAPSSQLRALTPTHYLRVCSNNSQR
uniref:EGF-like domain-containing protein n=1 Tax=Magallana gigas TaxID=29159 RepID=A0A8W8KID3_MAGGI